MESSDVIELQNSSDEEAKAPAAKKMKHLANVMVHIPRKLYDTTITPTRNKQKGVGKLSCTKIHNSTKVNLQSTNQIKLNRRDLLKNISRQNQKLHVNTLNPAPIYIPPNITISTTKRPGSGLKNIKPSSSSYIQVNKRKDFDPHPAVIPVVPPWYLKPEDHLNKESPEVTNNKEPTLNNMIEIVIEDSPIKLPNEPISEDVVCDDHDKTKTPSSKKKLDYPGNNENNINEIHATETASGMVIEIDSNQGEEILENEKTKESQADTKNLSVEQAIDTAIKPNDEFAKEKSKLDDQQNEVRTETVQDQTEKNTCKIVSEFHPIYQKFIDLCFELENSKDMEKIVEKKIKTYYKQVSKEYVESEEFLDMVSVKISLMKAGPEKMFLYIKDIVDELNVQRKMAKSQETKMSNITAEGSVSNTENMTGIYEEDSKWERRRRRQIHKLEKTIGKLHRAIQKLEQQEVDFDAEENSVYVRTERYKDRFVRVHAKLCQITKSKMPSEPYIHLQPRQGQPPGPAKRLEKWINKKVPLGTPLPFPDFHDVLKCVRKANEEDRLGWNEAEIMEEARDLFTRCGRKLQRRRQENEWRFATSLITQKGDPAQDNEALKKKLEENRREAVKNEADLVNKFAEQQTLLKLEGVEIGEKEAEESPDESEDEEMNDDNNSLYGKGKSHEESECLSRDKDVPENVLKIIEKEKSMEQNTSDINTMNTSNDLIPGNSHQQITRCLVQSEVEAANMQNVIGKNLATAVTSNGGKDNKVKNSDTPTVLISLVDDAETQNNMDNDNLVTQRTSDPERIEYTNDPYAPNYIKIILTSLAQDAAKDTETQNSMVSYDLSRDTTFEAVKIEDVKQINYPDDDAPVILADSLQNETEGSGKHNFGDKDDIAKKVICDSVKIENIAEKISNPEKTIMLPCTVKNETEDAKFQNSMDKDNLATELTSDTENEDIVKVPVKFEYNEHINLVNDDSDCDESNLLQKFHSGDEQSSCSESETKESSDESLITISDTSKIDSDDDDNVEKNDVISIENSSYSESESTKYAVDNENILLASSEDEDEDCNNKDIALSKYCGNYVNLKDDDISISETQLQKVAPIIYDIDETVDCEISQTVNNVCDENSSHSVKISNDLINCSGEEILD